MGSKFCKTLPEFVYFTSGLNGWLDGPYVNAPKGKEARKFKLIEVEEFDFDLHKELYGKHVQVNDRFETVLKWNRETAIKNKGKYVPEEISKEKYDAEMKHPWNIEFKNANKHTQS